MLANLENSVVATGLDKIRFHSKSKEKQYQSQIIIFIAAKDGEALYSQQKQERELTAAQIMNSLLPNSDFN